MDVGGKLLSAHLEEVRELCYSLQRTSPWKTAKSYGIVPC